MNQKQRKAKLKRANQHRLASKVNAMSNDLEACIDDEVTLRYRRIMESRTEAHRRFVSGEMVLPFDPKPKRNGWNLAVIMVLAIFIGLPLVTCGIAILIG